MTPPLIIDSNVLLDIVTEDRKWFPWSSKTLQELAEDHRLAINPIIYAEVSAGYKRIEELESALPPETFLRLNLPWEAAFLAGKCFLTYRKRSGSRRSPLPDFYIGAHAAILNTPLVTRDKRLFKTYFPSLKIVSPD